MVRSPGPDVALCCHPSGHTGSWGVSGMGTTSMGTTSMGTMDTGTSDAMPSSDASCQSGWNVLVF